MSCYSAECISQIYVEWTAHGTVAALETAVCVCVCVCVWLSIMSVSSKQMLSHFLTYKRCVIFFFFFFFSFSGGSGTNEAAVEFNRGIIAYDKADVLLCVHIQ